MKSIADDDFYIVHWFVQLAARKIKGEDVTISEELADKVLRIMDAAMHRSSKVLSSDEYAQVMDAMITAMNTLDIQLKSRLKMFDDSELIIQYSKEHYDEAVKAYEILKGKML